MKLKPDTIERLYYSIGEISLLLKVNASMVRFWEKELNLTFKYSKYGTRYFTAKDVELIKTIKHLRFERKFTMEGTKQELKTMGLL